MKSNRSYILYVLLLSAISCLLWAYAKSLAMPIILIIGAVMLAITNDISTIFPSLVNVIFVNGTNVADINLAYWLYISVALFILVIIYYCIRNKIKFRLSVFGVILLIFGVLGLVPLIWNMPDNIGYVVLYFGWVLYFLVYLFAKSTFKDNVDRFSYSMEGLAILISLQTIYMALNIFINKTQSYHDIYSLGWGMCNEAGIMLICTLPFIFYRIYKALWNKKLLIHLAILFICALGVISTFSRGAYLFAFIEGLALLFYILIKKKYYKTMALLSIGLIALAAGFVYLKYDWIHNHLCSLFDDNGRFNYYELAYNTISEGPLNAIFGAGFIHHIDYEGRIVVCHSTIYETLTVMGILGIVVLVCHFVCKYYKAIKCHNEFGNLMLIGFILIDIYGLIDNTYHMYYFMIIFMMSFAILELHQKEVE